MEAGLRPNTGPYAVVTTLGLFHFDRDNEMILSGINPKSSVQEIQDKMQWEIKISDQVKQLPAPTGQALALLRQEIDPEGMYLNNHKAMEKRNRYYSP